MPASVHLALSQTAHVRSTQTVGNVYELIWAKPTTGSELADAPENELCLSFYTFGTGEGAQGELQRSGQKQVVDQITAGVPSPPGTDRSWSMARREPGRTAGTERPGSARSPVCGCSRPQAPASRPRPPAGHQALGSSRSTCPRCRKGRGPLGYRTVDRFWALPRVGGACPRRSCVCPLRKS